MNVQSYKECSAEFNVWIKLQFLGFRRIKEFYLGIVTFQILNVVIKVEFAL